MTDTHPLKANCDLRRLVEQDLGPAPLHGGRAYLWKCPFHLEQKGYSLAVWANGYRCFGACATHGDALDWLKNYRHLNFADALKTLNDPSVPTALPEQVCLKAHSNPPEWAWQHRAEAVVCLGEETLWSEAGQPALGLPAGTRIDAAHHPGCTFGIHPRRFSPMANAWKAWMSRAAFCCRGTPLALCGR